MKIKDKCIIHKPGAFQNFCKREARLRGGPINSLLTICKVRVQRKNKGKPVENFSCQLPIASLEARGKI